MTRDGARESFLRVRKEHEHGKVTYVELFFDLVFVFAVTQLSHTLLEHLDLSGALHTGLLLMAVWWVWIFTSWITNWLDPERTPVRLALLVLMLAGLVLSTSLPQAFEARGLVFACAYVFMQVARTIFALWAAGPGNRSLIRNFQRILAWLALAGCFWIAGGLQEGSARLAFWVLALVIEYISPSTGFWTPGIGRSDTSDWDVEGHHMAERCALFVIIALGESVLVTGATFATLEWSGTVIAAASVSFIGSVAMWWIYFDTGAERGSAHIVASSDPGRLARRAYTYIHLLIIAGIIVAAVADELVLAHPDAHASLATIAVLIGGPALYVVGNLLFKHTISGRLPLSHLVGLGLFALLLPFASGLTPLALSTGTTLILLVVAGWERRSLYRAGLVPET